MEISEDEESPPGAYAEAVKENKNRDISIRANNPSLTWWARWSSVATPILLTAGIGVGGYFCDRFLNHVDKIADAQAEQAAAQTKIMADYKLEMSRSLSDIIAAAISLRSDMNIMNGHFNDTQSILSSRVDALSAWTKRNSDDIDKLKDMYYKSLKSN